MLRFNHLFFYCCSWTPVFLHNKKRVFFRVKFRNVWWQIVILSIFIIGNRFFSVFCIISPVKFNQHIKSFIEILHIRHRIIIFSTVICIKLVGFSTIMRNYGCSNFWIIITICFIIFSYVYIIPIIVLGNFFNLQSIILNFRKLWVQKCKSAAISSKVNWIIKRKCDLLKSLCFYFLHHILCCTGSFQICIRLLIDPARSHKALQEHNCRYWENTHCDDYF